MSTISDRIALRWARVESLRSGGATIDQIAERLGVGRSTVVNDLHAIGLCEDRSGRVTVSWTDEMDDNLIALYNRGVTHKEIAAQAGCTLHAVETRVSRLIAKGRLVRRPMRAHNKGATKPLPAAHAELLRRIQDIEGWARLSVRELAAQLGVPVNKLKVMRRRLQLRGLVPSKAQGRRCRNDAEARPATSAGQEGEVSINKLWAMALGRAR